MEQENKTEVVYETISVKATTKKRFKGSKEDYKTTDDKHLNNILDKYVEVKNG